MAFESTQTLSKQSTLHRDENCASIIAFSLRFVYYNKHLNFATKNLGILEQQLADLIQ